jgi:hypothetical protein
LLSAACGSVVPNCHRRLLSAACGSVVPNCHRRLLSAACGSFPEFFLFPLPLRHSPHPAVLIIITEAGSGVHTRMDVLCTDEIECVPGFVLPEVAPIGLVEDGLSAKLGQYCQMPDSFSPVGRLVLRYKLLHDLCLGFA